MNKETAVVRRIERSYSLSDRDVYEAIVHWLKSKDMIAPRYVGDTPCTKWIKEPTGIRVEWAEEDEIDV
jgi:hypothetical protein